jgi:hypothetical protein
MGKSRYYPAVDVFDGWHTYLVEHEQTGLCVAFCWDTQTYIHARLQYGEFDRVLAEATAPLLAIYERHAPP